MQVRRLTIGDETYACQVINQVKLRGDGVEGVTVTPEYMCSFLADQRHYLIAALIDQLPVGFALGYQFPRVDGGRPMVFFYEIGVDAQYRRRGIGRALVEELKRQAQASGCCKMFVPTSAFNSAAMALYKAAGGVGGARPDAAAFEWYW